MDIISSHNDMWRHVFWLSRSSISQVLMRTSLELIQTFWQACNLSMLLQPLMFRTMSNLGTRRRQICRENSCIKLGLLGYMSMSSGLAIATSISSTYIWRACTWSSSFTWSWIPKLIIFHQSPTGISWIFSVITCWRVSMSIVLVKNKSQPMDTSFSDCKQDCQSPNLFSLHHGLNLMNFGNGWLIPIRMGV